jgi:hypothetical protein
LISKFAVRTTYSSVPGVHIPPLRGWRFGGACSTACVRSTTDSKSSFLWPLLR